MTWNQHLSAEALAACSRWPKPCRAMFELLQERYPYDLLRLVDSEALRPPQQTFAAEELGNTKLPEAKPVLQRLVRSDSLLVAEGAEMGLDALLEDLA